MQVSMLKAKIHNAVVTDANIHYEGSITIDTDLLAASGIREFEKVHVASIDTGERLETYVIAGTAGSGTIQINGAAANAIKKGEHVIIMAYELVDETEAKNWRPKVVKVDEINKIKGAPRVAVH